MYIGERPCKEYGFALVRPIQRASKRDVHLFLPLYADKVLRNVRTDVLTTMDRCKSGASTTLRMCSKVWG